MNTITQPALREFAFTQSDFQFLAKLANSKTGIVLAEQKKDMIYGRLARRLRALGLESFSEYCALMQSEAGADEIGELVNAITTNLTSFFREGHHFTHLRDEMLPSIKDKKLRIWSSACSSGMEPYSIAMTLRAATPDLDRWDARILATDIDSNMVKIGSEGEYSASDLDGIPALCKKYVERSGKPNRACMSDDLKKLIAFRQLNLLETWPMKGQFDAVFCRNVVIYFDNPTKQKLFARMAEAIKPNGWLYIGHSENLHGISDRFELVGRTIYRRIK
jgi:chemotaxis protein methyltransferase CheR